MKKNEWIASNISGAVGRRHQTSFKKQTLGVVHLININTA